MPATALSTPAPEKSERLLSLDLLRGFDMLVLVALHPVLMALFRVWKAPEWLRYHAGHVRWEGFAAWDLVMPLFMFLAGTALPFSMRKYRSGERMTWRFWFRLAKRMALLWGLGMVVQGNLLSLNPDHFRLYSNTLQAIAAGYLIATLTLLTPKIRVHVIIAALLLAAFWAAMRYASFTFDGVTYGGGSYAPQTNLAEGIDRIVLGGWRDGASRLPDGSIRFAPWYTYTWILSSLTFGVTVLLGSLAGELLLVKRFSPMRKTFLLAASGFGLCLGGWLWSFEHPVVKPLFTCSFTLIAAGWSMLLLAVFHLFADVLRWRWGSGLLAIFGVNALAAYLLGEYCGGALVTFADRFLFGLRPIVGNAWYGTIQQAGAALLIIAILWVLRRAKLFLRA